MAPVVHVERGHVSECRAEQVDLRGVLMGRNLGVARVLSFWYTHLAPRLAEALAVSNLHLAHGVCFDLQRGVLRCYAQRFVVRWCDFRHRRKTSRLACPRRSLSPPPPCSCRSQLPSPDASPVRAPRTHAIVRPRSLLHDLPLDTSIGATTYPACPRCRPSLLLLRQRARIQATPSPTSDRYSRRSAGAPSSKRHTAGRRASRCAPRAQEPPRGDARLCVSPRRWAST